MRSGQTACMPSWTMSLEERVNLLGDDNGLPEASDVAATDAVNIAHRRLASIGYDVSAYDVSVWYKHYDRSATDNSVQHPFYLVYFMDDINEAGSVLCVRIEAATGAVSHIYTPGLGM